MRALVRAASSQYHSVVVVVCLPDFQRFRDLADLRLGIAHHLVDEGALAGTARTEHQRGPAAQQRLEDGAGLRRVGAQRHGVHIDAHRDVGPKAQLGGGEGRQVTLVQDDAAGNAGRLGRDKRARHLRLAEHRLGRDDEQQLVDVGGERLRLPGVLPIQQVAACQRRFDHPFIAGALPANEIADHAFALLAARVAQHTLPTRRLDDDMPAMAGYDSPGIVSRRRRQGHRPWLRR